MVKPFKFHALLSVSFERFCTHFFSPSETILSKELLLRTDFYYYPPGYMVCFVFQQDEKKCTQWKVLLVF